MLKELGNMIASGGISTGFNMFSQAVNNQFTEQMYDKQKKFWYEQQEYNSPANQVKRLQEAGINPQFAIGNIQSGQLGSAPSPMSPTAAQSANFGALSDNILKSLQGKQVMAQTRDENADAFLKEINGITQGMRNIMEIAEIIGRTDKNAADALRSRVEAWSNHLMTGAEYRKTMLEGDEIQTQIEMNITQNQIWQTELKFLPEQKKLQIQQMAADISLKIAQKELTLEQAKRIWYESHDLWQSAEGKRIDNELKEATFDNLVLKSYYDAFSVDSAWSLLGGTINSSRLIKDKFNGNYVPYNKRKKE